jgi:hypothetical protein
MRLRSLRTATLAHAVLRSFADVAMCADAPRPVGMLGATIVDLHERGLPRLD